ncbi:WD40 repeat domain-containing serine/threonine protein kinase [Nonomuraea sp. ZG12]|uniref:WD40 repeat domain-containing serine/threonine protein kinase n=1 Tax=Nonomuraea sp. ZG12 TaxID=3452207 RepID=UPI003F8B017F
MSRLRQLQHGELREVAGYRLLRGLGDGGQGSVYLGEDHGGRQVAIKILHARLLGDRRATRRFLQECELAEKVAAFCTARVIGSGLVAGRPYIVSEYVPGPSLQESVVREGARTGGALERLAVGTAAALNAIHRAGIVHRDFKPANILLGPDGPRVIDFGIAKAMEAGTTASSVVGTPGYMSPEQIAGEPASAASDMFSWASTVAYAATGRALFAGESIPAVMHRILTEEPDLPDVAEPLRSLLAGCLDKRPAARPTASDVLHALMEGDEGLRRYGGGSTGAASRRPGRAVTGTRRTATGGRAEARPMRARPSVRRRPATGDEPESPRRRPVTGDVPESPRRRPVTGDVPGSVRAQVEHDGRHSGELRRGVARPASPVRRRRAKAAGAVAVTLVGGITLGLLWRGSDSPPAGTSVTSEPAVAEQLGRPFGLGKLVDALAVGVLDGRTVVAAAAPQARNVQLWDPATGERLAVSPSSDAASGVTALEFVQVDGVPSVAWSSKNGFVSHWAPGSPVVTAKVCGSDAVMAAVPRKEDPVVAVGCPNGRLQGWDLRTGKKTGPFHASKEPVSQLAWTGEDGLVAFSSRWNGLRLANLWGGAQGMSPQAAGEVTGGEMGEVLAIAAAPGQPVAVGVRGRGADLHDHRTGRRRCAVAAPDGAELTRLAITGAGGRGLLYGSGGAVLHVWETGSCARLASVPVPDQVTALAVGEIGGRQAVVAATGGMMRVWTVRGGR